MSRSTKKSVAAVNKVSKNVSEDDIGSSKNGWNDKNFELVTDIKNLFLEKGEKILMANGAALITRDEKYGLYEVCSYVYNMKKEGHDENKIVKQILTYMSSRVFIDQNDFVLGLPGLKEYSEKVIDVLNEKQYRISIDNGLYKCRKCGSMSTALSSKQTRSADEGATNYIMCLDCGTKGVV